MKEMNPSNKLHILAISIGTAIFFGTIWQRIVVPEKVLKSSQDG
jgi:hypothetical protein